MKGHLCRRPTGPQPYMANGVPLEAVSAGLPAALADGAARHDVSADLILCFLRDLGAGPSHGETPPMQTGNMQRDAIFTDG